MFLWATHSSVPRATSPLPFLHAHPLSSTNRHPRDFSLKVSEAGQWYWELSTATLAALCVGLAAGWGWRKRRSREQEAWVRRWGAVGPGNGMFLSDWVFDHLSFLPQVPTWMSLLPFYFHRVVFWPESVSSATSGRQRVRSYSFVCLWNTQPVEGFWRVTDWE